MRFLAFMRCCPNSLNRICTMAFIDCGFEEINLPAGTILEEQAFSCKTTIKVKVENAKDKLEEMVTYYRANGIPFLKRQKMELPKDTYWKNGDFCALAKRCSSGDIGAMNQMADFFSEKAKSDDKDPFYRCAAHFWVTRAWLYGSKKAREYLVAWTQEHTNAQMTSPYLNEKLSGYATGEELNALGFLGFDEKRAYCLREIDAQGVVEVSAWESSDGPDEDGFGMEEHYDWWYLNECLVLSEGIDYFHSYSNHDKLVNKNKFQYLHDQVASTNKRNRNDII